MLLSIVIPLIHPCSRVSRREINIASIYVYYQLAFPILKLELVRLTAGLNVTIHSIFQFLI